MVLAATGFLILLSRSSTNKACAAAACPFAATGTFSAGIECNEAATDSAGTGSSILGTAHNFDASAPGNCRRGT